MVKYARLNADKGDKSAVSFAKKYRLDLIEIPPEFQDESLDDIAIKKDKRTRRTIIRMRSNRDISKSETGFEGTGEYNFEDNNLDIFNIADYK